MCPLERPLRVYLLVFLDEEKKAKAGFNAYGIGNDHNDPVNKALHGLIGHSVTVDQHIAFILETIGERWACQWKKSVQRLRSSTQIT